MDIRDSFSNLLDECSITTLTSEEEFNETSKRISSWINKNKPTSLFRYQSGGEYCIEDLENDIVSGSKLRTFNDICEDLIYCDFAKTEAAIEKEFSFETTQTFLNSIGNDDEYNKNLKSIIAPNLYNEFLKLKDSINLRANLLSSQKSLSNYYLNIFRNNSPELFCNVEGWIKGSLFNYFSACFSEVNDSLLMWEHYGNSNKGYCLEYDTNDLFLEPSVNSFVSGPFLAPIIYSENKVDATELMNFLIFEIIKHDNHLDEFVKPYFHNLFINIRVLLTKVKEWSYEKEWRLYKQEISNNDYAEVIKAKPKAIYLGNRMDKKQKDTIRAICLKKDIRIYTMTPDYFSASAKLVALEETNTTK